MTMNIHIETLVRAKQTALRKLTTNLMVAAAVVMVGGVLHHQLPILGDLVAMAGLLAAGWISCRIWDAYHIDTKFYG